MTEPHPMYNFTQAELSRFPNLGEAVEKTASEIEGALYFVVGEMGITHMPRNIMNIVDKGIDGTDAQKEAVMIAALYYLAPVELAQGKGNFAAQYGADAGAVLEELASQDREDITNVLPEKTAQAVAVMSTALLKAQRAIMGGGPDDELPPAEIVDAVKQGMAQTDSILLPNLNAPKLQALYEQEKKNTLDMLEGKPAAQEAPKPRKRSNGFDF